MYTNNIALKTNVNDICAYYKMYTFYSPYMYSPPPPGPSPPDYAVSSPQLHSDKLCNPTPQSN